MARNFVKLTAFVIKSRLSTILLDAFLEISHDAAKKQKAAQEPVKTKTKPPNFSLKAPQEQIPQPVPSVVTVTKNKSQIGNKIAKVDSKKQITNNQMSNTTKSPIKTVIKTPTKELVLSNSKKDLMPINSIGYPKKSKQNKQKGNNLTKSIKLASKGNNPSGNDKYKFSQIEFVQKKRDLDIDTGRRDSPSIKGLCLSPRGRKCL